MLTCESCGKKTSSLFNCECRLLICPECKAGQHKLHIPEGKECETPNVPEAARRP